MDISYRGNAELAILPKWIRVSEKQYYSIANNNIIEMFGLPDVLKYLPKLT